jgi:ribosomal protein L19E
VTLQVPNATDWQRCVAKLRVCRSKSLEDMIATSSRAEEVLEIQRLQRLLSTYDVTLSSQSDSDSEDEAITTEVAQSDSQEGLQGSLQGSLPDRTPQKNRLPKTLSPIRILLMKLKTAQDVENDETNTSGRRRRYIPGETKTMKTFNAVEAKQILTDVLKQHCKGESYDRRAPRSGRPC